jgi:hypothetical protein
LLVKRAVSAEDREGKIEGKNRRERGRKSKKVGRIWSKKIGVNRKEWIAWRERERRREIERMNWVGRKDRDREGIDRREERERKGRSNCKREAERERNEDLR